MPETASNPDASDVETRDPAPAGDATDGPPDAYACYMTDEDDAQAQAARLKTLFDAADTVEEIEDGLRLVLPREGELAETAAAFAVLESWCCPWARYEVAFTREREGVVLEVRAPGDEEATALIHQYPAGEIPDGLETPDLPDGFEVDV